jgi:RNA-directed DNA polymerase
MTSDSGEPFRGTRRRKGEHRTKELFLRNTGDAMKSIPNFGKEVSTKQEQIALNAKRLPEMSFTSLAHHINLKWLVEAYRRTKKNKACGVDGVTAIEYEENLKENLVSLLNRAKSGRYKAPPVKRVYISKGKGKEMRPIGIPTLEDKILQRAIVMLLEPIYENDFYDSSYGFRPGKSQHQALKVLWKETMNTNGWIIDLDIRKYFDSIDHGKLREILKQRMNDGVISRLIGKWLKAGVMEGGTVSYTEEGTPQGGVISPLLSNIYLHEVLDKWFVEAVKPRMKGKAFMMRFADDAIIGLGSKADAERVMKVLPLRFEKFGLTLHPDKTKMADFRRPPKDKGDKNDKSGSPKTFDYLGFTHYWGKSRKGNFVVMRKTRRGKIAASLHAIRNWCRKNMHEPINEQAAKLNMKLKGHYGYYGIKNNYKAMAIYFYKVKCIWRKWLKRRTRRGKGISYEKFDAIVKRFHLPAPRIVHSEV